ncbi:GNAT family N-acetyltransferase [Microbacterium sp. ZW CA_36]|uniref:GNAT family N-acetyltransferase n=1 Tax=Microbacterium sp. ZW CA_36 TaxID=3378078 RepID=UPI0038551816
MASAEVRRATVDDAERVARLLHDFNTEFDTDSPGPVVLAERLRNLLAGPQTFALLGGEPARGVALVTLRPNVWYPGPVALLDEMYVAPEARGAGIGGAIVARLVADCRRDGVSAIEINVDEGDVDAQRFYEHHGFHGSDPQTDERAYYFFQEL